MDEKGDVEKDFDAPISSDVEEEANSYYEKMYKGSMYITEIVQLLQQMKSSTSQRQNDVFRCMIKNLFDECAYFNKYPDRELAITGTLFGQTINNLIVSSRSLGRALKYVYDSLMQPPDSKLFKFGMHAIQEFVRLLPNWPKYVSLLLSIKQLKTASPELWDQLNSASSQSRVKKVAAAYNAAVEAILNEKEPVSGATVFKALKLDKSLDTKTYDIPNEKTQDKILFIINNVSFDNIDSKIESMRQLLKETYYQWFSHYIVVKRASIEPNYHPLYVLFLEKLDSKLLMKHLLFETMKNCHELLNSDKTLTSSSERTLLKNLGIWLGSMTLARDKPILYKHLSFKDLLIEGFSGGRLIVVIPFVCKVLERVKDSRIFKPPNPWLMGVMRVLAELYHYADLKLNLKFEIEVLCKNICLDIKDVEPTTKLHAASNAQPEDVLSQQLQRTLQLAANTAPDAAVRYTATNVPTPSSTGSLGYPGLASFITVNPQIPLFQAQPNLKRIVHIAIERGIREIMAPVVERTVTIAEIATRDLVVKDFALESNEERMKHAAHCMVQALAGSLASVTCREPLRLSCLTHLRNLFLQNGISEQAMPEQMLFMLVADNLDAACMIMERLAGEKATAQIDDALSENFVARKKHRMSSHQPFFDVAALTSSRYPAALPESIRATQLGVSPMQMQVYEDFAKISMHFANRAAPSFSQPNSVPATPIRSAASATPALPAATSATVSAPLEAAEVAVFNEEANAQTALDKWTAFASELEKLTGDSQLSSPSELSSSGAFRALLRQMTVTMMPFMTSEIYGVIVCQSVLQMIFSADSAILRACYVQCLEALCALSKTAGKEVSNWILYSDSPKKFSVHPIIALAKSSLVSLQEIDMQLARFVEADYTAQKAFAVELMQQCILDTSTQCATPIDFLYSLHALSLLNKKQLLSGAALDVFNRVSELGLAPYVHEDVESSLRDEMSTVFTEWVRLYHHPKSNEMLQLQFVADLQKQGWLHSSDASSLFFRLATEISVENFLKQKVASHHGPMLSAYQAVDAYACLIVYLIRFCPASDGAKQAGNSRLNLTTKILSIIVLVLVHSHERRRESFNQRPFFRLFSSMLRFLSAQESHFEDIYFQILSAFSSTFHTLQPLFLPGFALAWLQLIASRHFMLKLLLAENGKGWPFFQKILVDLFKFLAPFLQVQNEQMALVLRESVRLIYRGTLRLLLVLLHDFPEFLSEFHFNFVDVIPTNCVQLRNLILSAFPRTMRLPDPFTPNLALDALPEMSHAPRVLSDYTSILSASGLKGDLDSFLGLSSVNAKSPFLFGLGDRLLQSSASDDGVAADTTSRYNVSLINALVFYIGVNATSSERSSSHSIADALSEVAKDPSSKAISSSHPCVGAFVYLARELDVEGRFYLFGAMANHLRYPNSHTHFFSTLLLYVFATADLEIIQEQITRVLLERLIVNRPHPYGLLITFVELTRRPQYNFWDHTNFIRCAPEIERLFESVARSISQGYNKAV